MRLDSFRCLQARVVLASAVFFLVHQVESDVGLVAPVSDMIEAIRIYGQCGWFHLVDGPLRPS